MRIYQELREGIDSGDFKPEHQMPTEKVLQEKYCVSRDTVRRALAKLEIEGYIVRKASAGTFPRAKKTDYSLLNHNSFSEQMRSVGLLPSSEIFSIKISTDFPLDIINYLELAPDEKIYEICRLRKANGEPMAYEVVYIPQKLCPNLHTHVLEDTSLYELYEKHYNLQMDSISVKIEAEVAENESSNVLQVPSGSPILKVTSLMRLQDGRPLYYVVCKHIGRKYSFSAVLPRTGAEV